MAHSVIVVDGVVINRIVATAAEAEVAYPAATCIEVEESAPVGIGWMWDGDEFAPPTPTLDQVKAAEIAAIEAERDERQAQDFAWDFDGVTALDDYEHSAAAGVRYLQCRPLDIDNWMALYARADSLARRGYGAVTVPMRCEDNWNVQTTADQVIEVLDALFDRNAGLLFYAGRLKTQVRDATDVATVVAVRHAAEWPS